MKLREGQEDLRDADGTLNILSMRKVPVVLVSIPIGQVCCYLQPKAFPTDVSLLSWLPTLPSCPSSSSLFDSPSARPVNISVLRALCAGPHHRRGACLLGSQHTPGGTRDVPGCPCRVETLVGETENKQGEQIKNVKLRPACALGEMLG